MLYLAIDAGGTHTRALLADSTRILARTTTGTVKIQRVPEPEATARLVALLHEAAALANISLSAVSRTCIGLSGITIPAVRAWATRVLSATVAGELLLRGDEEIALDAAFAGGPGILIIAGTGNNAIGRSPAGEYLSAGGWGPILGDEGSGYWIGLEALRAACRAQDRIGLDAPATPLLYEIQHHWGLASLGDLIAHANHRGSANAPAPDFPTLAPIVARCAAEGDTIAAGILDRAGEELADLVTLVAHKMHADPPAHDSPLSVAYTGSILAQIPAVRNAMIAGLAVTLPNAEVQSNAVDPLEGALFIARQP